MSCSQIARAAQSTNAQMLHGIVCDMNGPPQTAAEAVARLTPLLHSGGLIVFTLKLGETAKWESMLEVVKAILCQNEATFQPSNEPQQKKRHHAQPRTFLYIGAYHLQQNRDELTLLFRCPVQ